MGRRGGGGGRSGGHSGNDGPSSGTRPDNDSNGDDNSRSSNSRRDDSNDNGTDSRNDQGNNDGQSSTEVNVTFEGGGYQPIEPPSAASPSQGSYSQTERSDSSVSHVEGYNDGNVGYETRVGASAENGSARAGAEAEVSAGPVSANASANVNADAVLTEDRAQLGVGGEARVGLSDSTETVNAGVVASANAGGTLSTGRTQIGAEAGVDAEASIGKGGNEFGVSAGVGVGGGVEVVHGEDSDGDGKFEVGGSFGLMGGFGGGVNFRFEPETIAENVMGGLEKLGSTLTKPPSNPTLPGRPDPLTGGALSGDNSNGPSKSLEEGGALKSYTANFESAIAMGNTQDAYTRLQEFL